MKAFLGLSTGWRGRIISRWLFLLTPPHQHFSASQTDKQIERGGEKRMRSTGGSAWCIFNALDLVVKSVPLDATGIGIFIYMRVSSAAEKLTSFFWANLIFHLLTLKCSVSEVRSRLEYCSQIWGAASLTALHRYARCFTGKGGSSQWWFYTFTNKLPS